MKRTISVIVFIMMATFAYSQENMATLSGGYVFANIEGANENGTGFRINGLFEYNQGQGSWAHGFSVGYIGLSAEVKETAQVLKYDINTWPLYYAPKYMFGSESFKGFVKGAIGWQISNFERSGTLGTISDNDTGFLGGGGVGVQYLINEKIFLSAEYELLYMSNSFYNDGLLNTASLGIGVRF